MTHDEGGEATVTVAGAVDETTTTTERPTTTTTRPATSTTEPPTTTSTTEPPTTTTAPPPPPPPTTLPPPPTTVPAPTMANVIFVSEYSRPMILRANNVRVRLEPGQRVGPLPVPPLGGNDVIEVLQAEQEECGAGDGFDVDGYFHAGGTYTFRVFHGAGAGCVLPSGETAPGWAYDLSPPPY